MRQGGDNIMGRQMIYFHLINQSYERKVTFVKRQVTVALIILNQITNENFRMEMNNTLAERSKKEKMDSLI